MASQPFASGLHPVQIPSHPDHHSMSGSATTTPTFSPANKPTPLVGSWADYGWDKAGGEPNSATVKDEGRPKIATPLLPSGVSAFDERKSTVVRDTHSDDYLSQLLSDAAKVTDLEDIPAPGPRSATPPPAPSPRTEPQATTYTRMDIAPNGTQAQSPRPIPNSYTQPQFPIVQQQTQQLYPLFFARGSTSGFSFSAPPRLPDYPLMYQAPFAPLPTQVPQEISGHLMPNRSPGVLNPGIMISKFTPPPPPNVLFAAEIGGPESETPAAKVGEILFNLGRRWVQKLEVWLSAYPRERPNAPCPSPEQYTTIEEWLQKLGIWYEANFNGRKVAGSTRGRPRGVPGAQRTGKGPMSVPFADTTVHYQ